MVGYCLFKHKRNIVFVKQGLNIILGMCINSMVSSSYVCNFFTLCADIIEVIPNWQLLSTIDFNNVGYYHQKLQLHQK